MTRPITMTDVAVLDRLRDLLIVCEFAVQTSLEVGDSPYRTQALSSVGSCLTYAVELVGAANDTAWVSRSGSEAEPREEPT